QAHGFDTEDDAGHDTDVPNTVTSDE
ncbi:MAG: hypothetical protein QOD32_1535, partial [Pyrinomonadaceae bacterium]|nr:hypothetical protein [Pyrinomonadaceae bacterium]